MGQLGLRHRGDQRGAGGELVGDALQHEDVGGLRLVEGIAGAEDAHAARGEAGVVDLDEAGLGEVFVAQGAVAVGEPLGGHLLGEGDLLGGADEPVQVGEAGRAMGLEGLEVDHQRVVVDGVEVLELEGPQRLAVVGGRAMDDGAHPCVAVVAVDGAVEVGRVQPGAGEAGHVVVDEGAQVDPAGPAVQLPPGAEASRVGRVGVQALEGLAVEHGEQVELVVQGVKAGVDEGHAAGVGVVEGEDGELDDGELVGAVAGEGEEAVVGRQAGVAVVVEARARLEAGVVGQHGLVGGAGGGLVELDPVAGAVGDPAPGAVAT